MTYSLFKANTISGRYITNADVELLNALHTDFFKIDVIGYSVNNLPIYAYSFGSGKKRILGWSQMHGNESTTTKAVFDFFNWIKNPSADSKQLLETCTFCIVPILNPDGASAYTRLNANGIDLNRDAINKSQPESRVLHELYSTFKPDYCFNLHGQRTIFSAGNTNNSAVLSFLSPAENMARTVTSTRKTAMAVIVAIYNKMSAVLPNQIARYDDAYNGNCVGDCFQSLGTPTILVEAGHVPGDYNREITRKHVFNVLLAAFKSIALDGFESNAYKAYAEIPENKKLFTDVLIRNARDDNGNAIDVAIQYEEVLRSGAIYFVPKLAAYGDLSEHFGHTEINGEGNIVLINKSKETPELLSIINEISLNNINITKKIVISS